MSENEEDETESLLRPERKLDFTFLTKKHEQEDMTPRLSLKYYLDQPKIVTNLIALTVIWVATTFTWYMH